MQAVHTRLLHLVTITPTPEPLPLSTYWAARSARPQRQIQRSHRQITAPAIHKRQAKGSAWVHGFTTASPHRYIYSPTHVIRTPFTHQRAYMYARTHRTAEFTHPQRYMSKSNHASAFPRTYISIEPNLYTHNRIYTPITEFIHP